MTNSLDKTDLLILEQLQKDASLTNAELSERVNLSPTPCLRRVRRMENAGVIKSYSVVVDRKSLGLNVSALVSVELEKNTKSAALLFEEGIKDLSRVVECAVVSGNYDYVLRVVAKDLEDYERFTKEELADVAGIRSLSSTIILSQPISKSALPTNL